MKLSEVPKYVKEKYRLTVSRQTVYNWTKFGVGGVKLRVYYITSLIETDCKQVDYFIEQSGILNSRRLSK
jgi:hypothetical protein